MYMMFQSTPASTYETTYSWNFHKDKINHSLTKGGYNLNYKKENQIKTYLQCMACVVCHPLHNIVAKLTNST